MHTCERIVVEDGCNISEVETADMDDKRKTMWNLKELYESLFLIIPKTHEVSGILVSLTKLLIVSVFYYLYLR